MPGAPPATGSGETFNGSDDETPTGEFSPPSSPGAFDGPLVSISTGVHSGATAGGTLRSPDPARHGPPSRIGRYRVVRQIGQGGMGAVYLVTPIDAEQPTPMALKVIRGGLAGEESVTRFRRERRVLAQLDHPNIAKLLDADETEEGDPYFVMEYVDGQSIDEYCDSHRLTIDERLNIFRAVCAAVHHAHQNLVVHRDIKPRNILVTADGVAKLLDFGIAKLISHTMSSGPDLPTAPEVRAMTPEYASPEQIRGLPVSTATDIYSLGVVLYELLSGRRPHHFVNRGMREVERTVCEVEPERPSTLVTRADQPMHVDEEGKVSAAGPVIDPDQVAKARSESPQRLRRILGRDLDNIVLMALRKEPQRRYSSAEAFGEDIRRQQEGHPVIAAPDSFRYRSIKFVTRHRVGAAATIAVAATLVFSSVAVTWKWREAVYERDRADRRFNEVRSLANVFINEVYDAVNRLEGSTAARNLLVQEGLKYLDGLRAEAAGNLTLMDEIAGGYHRLADVQGGIRANNLGNTSGALTSYETAEAIRRELLAAAPQDPRAKLQLANSMIGVADAMRKMGGMDDALARYGDAAALLEPLVAAAPDDPVAKKVLSVALQSAGDILCQTERYVEAADLFDRSLAIRQSLLAAAPDDVDLQRSISTALTRAGRLAEMRDLPDDAIRHYGDSLEIRRRVASAMPTDSRAQRDLLTMERTLGDTLRDAGRTEEALARHGEAAELAQRLFTADAKNERGRLDLALSRESLGRTLTALARYDEARRELEAAIVHAEEAQSRDSKYLINVQAAASAHESLARLLAEMDRDANAKEIVVHLRRCLELWRLCSAATSSEGEPSGQIDVIRVAGLLGLAMVQAEGPTAEARTFLDESAAGYAKLAAAAPLAKDVESQRQSVLAALARR